MSTQARPAPRPSTEPRLLSRSSCAPTSRSTFTELVDARAAWPKSTASRLLRRSSAPSCSSATAPASYVAGALFALYAARHDPWRRARSGSRGPTLRPASATQTGETVNLAVAPRRHGRADRPGRRAYLLGTRDWVERRRARRTAPRSARCFYAYGALAAARRRPRAAVPTAHRHRPRAQLRRELARCAARGYAVTRRRAGDRARRRRAPVRGRDGEVVAALGMSGPSAAASPDRARPDSAAPGRASADASSRPAPAPHASGRRARHDPRRDPARAVRRDPGRQRALPSST